MAGSRDSCDPRVGEPLAKSSYQGRCTCSLEPGAQVDFMYILESAENRLRKMYKLIF